METMPPFNLAVIVITGIISYAGFTRPGFSERFLFDTQSILRYRQYYRIISSAFLHGNWMHLIFNMYTLYSFGGAVEQVFGPVQFLVIYFAAVVGGNLLSLVLHRHHEYRALGASGGVCGIIFACIFLLPGSSVYMFFIPFPIPAHIFAIVFIIVSYIGLRGQIGNIGHDAHLGGAIIGLAVTTIMYPRIVIESPMLYSGVMGLSVTIMLLLYFYPLHLPGHTYQPVWNQPKPTKEKNNIADEPPTDEEVIERLLEKVSKHGINSLSYVEKSRLEAISRKRKQQEQSKNQKYSSQV